MGRIALLSEELINKIAAGEVVERPASIVKELAENSLDAGARRIQIALEAGGCSRISITDDGIGMSAGDAELAIRRHATSKLHDLDGLFRICTLGFRGEALPAIASVSRFTLTTAEPESSVGFRLRVEGGQVISRGDAPPIAGTSIDVEELFYNVPARRKFMRRPQTELAQAREAVVRLALAHPEVAFFLEHEGRALLSFPPKPGDARERLALALGAEIHPHLIEVEERRLGVSVNGYAASPDFTLPNARGIYTFVNRRYVRDRGLNHSVQRAFRDVLPLGRQPVIALTIEVDPRAVDVNVHPQKLEVRFADSAAVYEAVFSALQRALRPGQVAAGAAAYKGTRAGPGYAQAVQQFLERSQSSAWGGPLPAAATHSQDVHYGRSLPNGNAARPDGYFSSLRYIGAAANRYWVCESDRGFLVALDAHAALERVRRSSFERILEQGFSPQRCLFSATVPVSADEAKLLEGRVDFLLTLGLEVEAFGRDTFAIKSLPAELLGADPRKLLSDLAAAEVSRTGDARAELLPILACHAAATSRGFSAEEVQAVLRQLDRSDSSLRAIHGTVVALEVPLPSSE
jgi:DNA mismatch repair protein MutL